MAGVAINASDVVRGLQGLRKDLDGMGRESSVVTLQAQIGTNAWSLRIGFRDYALSGWMQEEGILREDSDLDLLARTLLGRMHHLVRVV